MAMTRLSRRSKLMLVLAVLLGAVLLSAVSLASRRSEAPSRKAPSAGVPTAKLMEASAKAYAARLQAATGYSPDGSGFPDSSGLYSLLDLRYLLRAAGEAGSTVATASSEASSSARREASDAWSSSRSDTELSASVGLVLDASGFPPDPPAPEVPPAAVSEEATLAIALLGPLLYAGPAGLPSPEGGATPRTLLTVLPGNRVRVDYSVSATGTGSVTYSLEPTVGGWRLAGIDVAGASTAVRDFLPLVLSAYEEARAVAASTGTEDEADLPSGGEIQGP